MEAAIFWPNVFSCKIYCSHLECCEQTDNALSLLLLHTSINYTVRRGLLSIKCEHEALGLKIKGMGTQVVFSQRCRWGGRTWGAEWKSETFPQVKANYTLCSDNKGFVCMTKAPSMIIKKAELRIDRIELTIWEKTFFNMLARLFRTRSDESGTWQSAIM